MSESVPVFQLTPAQRALVLGVPGLAEHVADEFCRARRLVLPEQHLKELVGLGHLGVVYAALTFDPTRRVPFEFWARLRAAATMRDGVRKVRKDQILAAACHVAMLVLGCEYRLFDGDVADLSEEFAESAIEEVEDCTSLAMMLDVARPREFEGEDELVVIDTWMAAHGGLKSVLDDLHPEDLSLIKRLFVLEKKIKNISKSESVDYGTLRDRYKALIRRMRARMHTLGIRGSPPRLERAWGLLDAKAGGDDPDERSDQR